MLYMPQNFSNPEQNLNYGQMNDRVINFWQKNNIFARSVNERDR
jgi:hypothetical protein